MRVLPLPRPPACLPTPQSTGSLQSCRAPWRAGLLATGSWWDEHPQDLTRAPEGPLTQCQAEGHRMGPQLRLGHQGSKDPSIPVKAQSSAGPLHRGPEIARLHLTRPQVWVRVGDQGGCPEPVPFLGGAPSMPVNFPHNEPVTPDPSGVWELHLVLLGQSGSARPSFPPDSRPGLTATLPRTWRSDPLLKCSFSCLV